MLEKKERGNCKMRLLIMQKINFALMQIIEETKKSGEQYVTPNSISFDNISENFSFCDKNNIYYEINALKSA